MRRVLAFGAVCAAGLVLAPMAPSGAQPLEREHYSFHDEDQFIDDECGEAMTIDYTIDGSGVFMLKQGRRGDPTPYFFDNYYSVETYTNVENGATATVVHQGLFKDLQVEHVEDTIYRFTAIESGRPITVYGPDGEKLIFDAGRIRYTFLVDTLGDTDLDNDVFLGDVEDPSVAGPHPVFVGEVDFCDLLDLLR